MKNKLVTSFWIYLFIGVNSYIMAQNIVEEKTPEELEREEWYRTEWPRIQEQGEKYFAEQRAKIHTFNDLEFTFWIPANKRDKRIIPWDLVFLNENLVLFCNSYIEGVLSPRFIIRYFIRNNNIFFTEKLTGYLEDGYLFIGDERDGFEKFELNYVIDFFDEVAQP